MEFRPLVFAALFFASALYALTRGGAPERWAASAYLSAYAVTVLLTLHKHHAYHGIEWGVFATDLGLAIALGGLALQANRMWTIWAVSFQLVGVTTHLVKLVVPELLAPAYALTLMGWSYAMIPLLLCATMRHRQRLRTYGSDRGWSLSSTT
jgi:hypothetical protein